MFLLVSNLTKDTFMLVVMHVLKFICTIVCQHFMVKCVNSITAQWLVIVDDDNNFMTM